MQKMKALMLNLLAGIVSCMSMTVLKQMISGHSMKAAAIWHAAADGHGELFH